MTDTAKKLIELSKSATPGPWAPRGESVTYEHDGEIGRVHCYGDREYIAACDPSTITALMTRYLKMEENFREMLDDIKQLDGHCPWETWTEADRFLKEALKEE